jgi:PhnB protein
MGGRQGCRRSNKTKGDVVMVVNAYLSFDGRCEEALEFYTQALGAKVEFLMRFSDAPADACPGMDKGLANKVLHCSFRVGETVMMATDAGKATNTPKFEGFTLSITTNTVAETEKYFNALTDGGVVTAPLNKTFFAEKFGMVKDKFGVHWMVLTKA